METITQKEFDSIISGLDGESDVCVTIAFKIFGEDIKFPDTLHNVSFKNCNFICTDFTKILTFV